MHLQTNVLPATPCNPWPHLRFYAGMPLIAQNGEKIGTLCVLDTVPQVLDSHQQLVLRILSNQVMKIVELKAGMKLLEKKQKELEEQKQLNNNANIRLRSFFESSTNFQVLLGRQGEVIDFNKTAYNFIRTVHKAKLQIGDQFVKYIHPEFVATFLNQYKLALQGTKSAKEGSTDYEEMGVIWWEAAFEAARDGKGEIIGVSYLIRNVTERKLKEQKIIAQNQSLLKIAHIQAHEFRAPLTTIMGLMSLIKKKILLHLLNISNCWMVSCTAVIKGSHISIETDLTSLSLSLLAFSHFLSVAFLRLSRTSMTVPIFRSTSTVTYSCRFWNDVSSTASSSMGESSRRARPRLTARSMMPHASSQLIFIRSETALTVATLSHEIAKASNNAVNPLPDSAQGTLAWRTP